MQLRHRDEAFKKSSAMGCWLKVSTAALGEDPSGKRRGVAEVTNGRSPAYARQNVNADENPLSSVE